MIPTIAQLQRIAGKSDAKSTANLKSLIAGLEVMGAQVGLDLPHRLAHYLARLMHESGGGQWDRELWGPTPAQKRYDTRADLGNTKAADGDGKLYMGRTMAQLTGKANYQRFTDWARKQNLEAPDFVKEPDRLNTDPWEGIVPLWFWATAADFNGFADENNAEQVCKFWNGGLNGYEDQLRFYTRASLVLLGFGVADVKGFQAEAQKRGLLPKDEAGKPPQVDGDFGPKSRAAAHQMLMALAAHDLPAAAKASPVTVTEELPVPVVAKGSDQPWWQRAGAVVSAGGPLAGMGAWLQGADRTLIFTLLGVGIVGTIAMLLWGELIVGRVKRIITRVEAGDATPKGNQVPQPAPEA